MYKFKLLTNPNHKFVDELKFEFAFRLELTFGFEIIPRFGDESKFERELDLEFQFKLGSAFDFKANVD